MWVPFVPKGSLVGNFVLTVVMWEMESLRGGGFSGRLLGL